MARVAAYKNDDVKVKLLEELRAGKTRHEAAGAVMTPLKTFEGWLDKDDDLRREVEAAEAEGAQARADKPVALDKKTGADRWRKMREDAARFAPGMLGFLLAVDALLQKKKSAQFFAELELGLLSYSQYGDRIHHASLATLLKVGITHELRHEAGEADEALISKEDVLYVYYLVNGDLSSAQALIDAGSVTLLSEPEEEGTPIIEKGM